MVDYACVLGFGLVFPSISLLTGLLSLLDRILRKRRSSPVFIPVIGPVVINVWLLLVGKPLWSLILPWVFDIGTVAFLVVSPRLLREWWRICRFTRQCLLSGERDAVTATISLHSMGSYYLQKKWQRRPGELGVLGLGELGQFRFVGSDLELRADYGWVRVLKPGCDGSYSVEKENDLPGQDYSLGGWVFRRLSQIHGVTTGSQ